jgi:hypothetical protein
VIYKTSDAGLNWTKLNQVSNALYFSGVNCVPNTSNVFIFGKAGSSVNIFSKTGDGGSNWFDFILLNDSTYYNDGKAVDNLNWFVCGGNFNSQAKIWRTTNGGGPIGIKSISNLIPKEFHLYQNYPNPFNPSTKIRFDIRGKWQTADVKLVIYNAIGKELALLIKQPLQPGTYEIEWDCSDFPTGIYFYSLRTGDFIQTGRMILLK